MCGVTSPGVFSHHEPTTNIFDDSYQFTSIYVNWIPIYISYANYVNLKSIYVDLRQFKTDLCQLMSFRQGASPQSFLTWAGPGPGPHAQWGAAGDINQF